MVVRHDVLVGKHQVLFATAEYLAGQMWPTATFRAGAQHRDLGPDSPRDGDKTGEERMAHAKPRLLRWLADRLRFGFSEWVSAGYYKEDFDALFNLADFCLDDEIRTRACMVIDLMLFELARFTQNGELGSTSGRVYADQKQCGWEQSIGGMLQLLFAAHGTVWVGMDSCESALASSRQYVPPDAILAIGQDTPDVFVDRSRVSVTFDEAPGYGVGTTSDEDVLFWWGKGAYVNKQIVEASHRVAKQYKLMHTDPFKQAFLPADIGSGLVSAAGLLAYALCAVEPLALAAVIPLVGNPFADESEGADLLSSVIEGSTLSRANLYTYRNRHAMLASVQDFHPGQLSFQGQFCQASLSPDATVWTTHPSAGLGIDETWVRIIGGVAAFEAGGPIGVTVEEILAKDIHALPPSSNGPGWWLGSVTVPRVVQMKNAAIMMYKPKGLQWLLSGGRTHAWFPKAAFDQGDEWSFGAWKALDCNVDTGRWIFGRVGKGYVGLFSAQRPKWTTDGDWKDKEIIADGDRNVFILQVGSEEEYGSYEAFMDRVQNARIHVNGLNWKLSDFECSYDIPRTGPDAAERGSGSDRLELHYDDDEDNVRLDGQPFDDYHFPRFENSYIRGGRVLWGQYEYTIECGGHSLTHDFRDLADRTKESPRVHRKLDGGPAMRIRCSKRSMQPRSSRFPAWARPTVLRSPAPARSISRADCNGSTWPGRARRTIPGCTGRASTAAIGRRRRRSSASALRTGRRSRRTRSPSGFDSGLAMAWKGVDDDSGLYFSINPTRTSNAHGWRARRTFPAWARATVRRSPGSTARSGSRGKASTAIRDSMRAQPRWKMVGANEDAGHRQQARAVARRRGQPLVPSMAWCRRRLERSHRGAARRVAHGMGRPAGGRLRDRKRRHEPDRLDARAGAAHPIDDALLAIWKGVSDDSAIYLSARDGDTWGGQVKWKGIGISRSPAAAMLGDVIVVAWKGVDDDHGLYFAKLTFAPGATASGIWFEWQA